MQPCGRVKLVSDADKPQSAQQFSRCFILWMMAGKDSIRTNHLKGVADDRPCRLGGVTLSPKGGTQMYACLLYTSRCV